MPTTLRSGTDTTTTGRAARHPARRGITAPWLRLRSPWTLPALIAGAAVWGMIVDGNFIPILAPTGNSTVFQASTAACFALLGILFGPLAGALGGLARDGSSAVVTLAAHPGMVTDPNFAVWAVKKAADIFEDVMLGWFPGLVAMRTRRPGGLSLAAALTAWFSLPFVVIVNTLAGGHSEQVWAALGTPVGDWDEPADPGLTVYALLTGSMVAFALARRRGRRGEAFAGGTVLGVLAGAMVILGAHP